MSRWDAFLNPRGAACGEKGEVRILHRSGAPFLVLPQSSLAACRALSLYPAQSLKARVLKKVVAGALLLRAPLFRASLSIEPDAPLVRFIREKGHEFGLKPGFGGLPPWAMLVGNSSAPGQRFVMVFFDEDAEPRMVVKVGQGGAACDLIRQEGEMLRLLPENLLGRTHLLVEWREGETSALVLPFQEGGSPSAQQIPELSTLLADWLAHGGEMPLSTIPSWSTLRAVVPNSAFPFSPEIGDAVVKAPIAHGDLAPWNIKSHGGKWTVIDWERGTLQGVPGWDWFHYTLQPGVLVRKWDAQMLADEASRVLESDPFQRYAEAARIRGLERALLLGYFVHCTEVIRQSEGREALVGAREILSRAWGVAG